MQQVELRDRYRGSLLGLAAGDAVGTTLEFRAPGTFTPIHDMVGGGPFHLDDNGPTILQWPCAWQRVWWRGEALTLATRCSAIFGGGMRATCPVQDDASILVSLFPLLCADLRSLATHLQALLIQELLAMGRSCGWLRCHYSMPALPARS